MYDIVTIGSVTWDNFVQMDYSLVDWPDTPEGKAIALPLGEKFRIEKVYSTVGGNSANASVTFSRQGFRTACFGKIAKDVTGKGIVEHLKKEKVTPLFSFSDKKPTAYSTLLLRLQGERTILSYHGASDTWVRSDIPWRKLKSPWWYLSLAGESDKFLKPLLKFAKQNNIRVAFNPSGHHIQHKRKEILSSLKNLDFLVLNTGEAADLVGMSFKREKEVFKKLDKLLTPGIVAVTDGPKGVTVSDGKYIYKSGVFKEQKIKDRTGAGDSFGSGFVAGLMHMQRPASSVQPKRRNQKFLTSNHYTPDAIRYAIRLATANATSVVENIGATEGALTKNEFAKDLRWKKFKITIKKI